MAWPRLLPKAAIGGGDSPVQQPAGIAVLLRPKFLLRDVFGNPPVRIDDEVLDLVAERLRLSGALANNHRYAHGFIPLVET